MSAIRRFDSDRRKAENAIDFASWHKLWVYLLPDPSDGASGGIHSNRGPECQALNAGCPRQDWSITASDNICNLSAFCRHMP